MKKAGNANASSKFYEKNAYYSYVNVVHTMEDFFLALFPLFHQSTWAQLLTSPPTTHAQGRADQPGSFHHLPGCLRSLPRLHHKESAFFLCPCLHLSTVNGWWLELVRSKQQHHYGRRILAELTTSDIFIETYSSLMAPYQAYVPADSGSFQPDRYVQTAIVKFISGLPRYGHSKNIISVLSNDSGKESYVQG